MDEHTLNDLLECSVCLDRLNTSSKVLPCQHTFCRKCLEVSSDDEIQKFVCDCECILYVFLGNLCQSTGVALSWMSYSGRYENWGSASKCAAYENIRRYVLCMQHILYILKKKKKQYSIPNNPHTHKVDICVWSILFRNYCSGCHIIILSVLYVCRTTVPHGLTFIRISRQGTFYAFLNSN